MAQHVFPAFVSESGRPAVDDPGRYRAALRTFAGKRLEFVLRAPRSKRSLDMNAYLHADTGPFRLLADHLGEDITGIKYALMGECFGWVWSAAAGREVPIKSHTSDMTVEESRYFVEWVIPWAAQNHGVYIPLPAEVM